MEQFQVTIKSRKVDGFCVYRHIRTDTNTPFYIGKGNNYRAFSTYGRNKYWNNIVKNTDYEVEIILENLQESEAFEKEKEFINIYKRLGYCEANMSLGGEGPAGFKHSKKTRLKMSKSAKGSKKTKDTKLKMSEYAKNRPESHLRNISESSKVKKISEKHKLNIKLAKAANCYFHSEETKAKISASNKGRLGSCKGKAHSDERKRKISESMKGKNTKKDRELRLTKGTAQ